MTDRVVLILLVVALTTLASAMVAAAAGVLARVDHATWPQAITRAALAFTTTISLTAALATAVVTLTH